MRFRPFGKIRTKATRLPPGGPWVALEKVHGAQLVVGIDRTSGWARVGKRKAWLDDDAAFFGWQLLSTELLAAARGWARTLGVNQLVAYGELYGGAYPHPDVPSVGGLQAVQTGVWYAPGLHWSPFDVLVAEDDDDEGVFLSYSELAELLEGGPFIPPPCVARGPRGDLLALPVAAPTRVPARHSLPTIADNIAEGLVLRPDRRAAPGERGLLKRKIDTFDDARFGEAEAWDPGDVGIDALLTWADRLVNPARLASARSKVGTDLSLVREEVVLDVCVDLEEAFPHAMAMRTEGEQAQLEATMQAAFSRLVDAQAG